MYITFIIQLGGKAVCYAYPIGKGNPGMEENTLPNITQPKQKTKTEQEPGLGS